VPILIDLLEDDNHFVNAEVLKELAKLDDERAIEPVAALFVRDTSLRDEAAACLRKFGSAAEEPVLRLSRPTDFIITRETVKLLGDIGTRKSIDPLRSLRQLTFYRLVEEDVRIAVNKIRLRLSQEKENGAS
jgi:HEAT repeat protein